MARGQEYRHGAGNDILHPRDFKGAQHQRTVHQVGARTPPHWPLTTKANLRLPQILLPDIEQLAGARDRIVGYSLNDSIRFRAAIGRELDVAPERIAGLVLGEHGDGQVSLFSDVTLDENPVVLDADQRDRITADINGTTGIC